ncbi:MAG: electron transport complex subunit RsxC [Odoribacteraceae bacterium]|nr:electron transport complex subunit RsxC [Odoribacteraceae bacterium]
MLKTFTLGGIHPAGNKLSSRGAIVPLPLPDQVAIPLSQHSGFPATPLVAKGDRVKVGQLIGAAAGFISANIHSSVSGIVVGVEAVADASGYARTAVIIRVEGDEWDENIGRQESPDRYLSAFSKDDMLLAIQSAGIVGMGGATFPTRVKLSPPPGSHPEWLIINGVECEPFLTADHRLMLEKSRELLIGIRFLMKALGVERAVIGIENNKPDAIASMREAVVKHALGIEVCPLRVKYPQGSEKQLIQAIAGRRVPPGALPISVGVVVHNVGTVYAVYEAVTMHKPLVERVVTVTGTSLARPGNYLCRVGTPVARLIEAAGGLPGDTGKVVVGGPMMGKALVTTDVVVTKGTSGVLVIPRKEARRKPPRDCIRCAKCVNACPMGLEPYLLMTLGEKQRTDDLEAARVTDCIECGSCSFTCPAHRSLLDVIRLGKSRVNQAIHARKQS